MKDSERRAEGKDQRSRTPKAAETAREGQVRVWGEMGLTLPIGDSTAHVRLLYGHERLVTGGLPALKRATKELHDFNEEELQKQMKRLRRAIREWTAEEDETPTQRARRRARSRG